MKSRNKAILIFTVAALAVGQMSMVAMAHGHGRGHHRTKVITYSQCNVDECNITEVHEHDGTYYCGHSIGDGHDYHEVCYIEGCEEMTAHEHDGVTYLCHGDNECHNVKNSCGGHHH